MTGKNTEPVKKDLFQVTDAEIRKEFRPSECQKFLLTWMNGLRNTYETRKGAKAPVFY
jgi:hypothetical protein